MFKFRAFLGWFWRASLTLYFKLSISSKYLWFLFDFLFTLVSWRPHLLILHCLCIRIWTLTPLIACYFLRLNVNAINFWRKIFNIITTIILSFINKWVYKLNVTHVWSLFFLVTLSLGFCSFLFFLFLTITWRWSSQTIQLHGWTNTLTAWRTTERTNFYIWLAGD